MRVALLSLYYLTLPVLFGPSLVASYRHGRPEIWPRWWGRLLGRFLSPLERPRVFSLVWHLALALAVSFLAGMVAYIGTQAVVAIDVAANGPFQPGIDTWGHGQPGTGSPPSPLGAAIALGAFCFLIACAIEYGRLRRNPQQDRREWNRQHRPRARHALKHVPSRNHHKSRAGTPGR